MTSPPTPPLEDDPCDVILKAMNGHGLTPQSLATQCNLPLNLIHQALDGTIPSEPLQAIAQALHLLPSALVGLATYLPTTNPPQELSQIITPFGHAGVNSFIIRHGASATLFDAGTEAAPILAHLEQEALILSAIYITHRHHDHIGGLTAFPKTPTYFAENLPHGEVKSFAEGLTLTTLETSGHFTPSRGYLIQGLSLDICICGDILFAGSMGKAPSPKHFQQSLRHLQENIMTLPADTLICPGHGPITTVAQEAKNNPFL